ncbi:hypothetical protein CHCC20375_2983 [Bacillus licheniformis]|nr:hypothetical protein CHCC20375_2983 [Bacillus licheniformis]
MLYFGNSNINVYLLSTDLTALYFFGIISSGIWHLILKTIFML